MIASNHHARLWRLFRHKRADDTNRLPDGSITVFLWRNAARSSDTQRSAPGRAARAPVRRGGRL